MRKKFLSLALALVMCLGLTVPAMAAEEAFGSYWTDNSPIMTLSDYITKGTGSYKIRRAATDVFTYNEYVIAPGTVCTAHHPCYLYLDKCELLEDGVYAGLDQDVVYAIEGTGTFTFTEEYAGYWFANFSYGEGSGELFLLHVTGESAAPVPEPTPEPTPAPTPEPAPTPSFTDVSPTSPYADAINWAVSYGITKGTSTTTFSPGQGCTNAQILTFLWRRNGEPEPTIANPFTNAIPDAYTKAAIWAYEMGMVSGTTFEADVPCTRAMTVTYLWIDNGRPECQLDASEGEIRYADSQLTARFTDVPASAPYREAVAWAIDWGVTNGTSETTFSPDQACTRGQIMTFIYRNTQ